MKIVAGMHVSLDGVVEAPERWSFDYYCDEVGQSIKSRRDATDVLLLGRNTYQEFAAIWPGQHGEVADFMNGTPKLVASTTLTSVDWSGAGLIDGDVVAALTALKQQPGRNITITGSAGLVRSLITAGLVDELHLMVCPVVLGSGKRLFDGVGARVPLRLAASETFPTGVAHLTYQPT
ncbi:dihydrofolate reductase family protein [Dactylosporangium sp. AC04546]|uniref:dihydrofolate reductase family protein n=1 Tax=Dactylosporangium sp. AC04546 TaxID=2862460 RepID=UPI001EDEEE52|nr:dihydrofolate reductase family protein [Dactylosporangium sp. AC04546]WVK82476.1 dihydrofolate reductase family protein [Dactylosporangium sp. AC04546]